MKFYKEIIGINKNAPTGAELTMTFSSKGFEFNDDLYLATGKKLFLNGNGGSAILFRNSGITIDDLSNHGLRFDGDSKEILFDFSNGNIEATNLNFGGVTYPLNNIYATNGYFNNIFLLPSSIINADTVNLINADTVNLTNLNTVSTNGDFNNIPPFIMSADTVNVTDLNFTPTNPVTLPKNSKIRVLNTEELDIAGAEIRTIIPNVNAVIKYRSSSTGNWVRTNQLVKWRGITTRASGKECIQFCARINVDAITKPYSALWIRSPFADEPMLVRDILQLSHRNTGSNTDTPSIAAYWEDPIYYLIVRNTYSSLGDLFIQITRFTEPLAKPMRPR